MSDVAIVDNESFDELSKDEQDQLDADLKELGVVPEQVVEKTVEKATDEEAEHEDDKDLPEDVDKSPEEREAIRARRRNERQQKKQWRKEKEESQQREIDSLRKQLQEVNEWKNTVEHRNVQSGVAQIDKAISDAEQTLQLARSALKEATVNQDGDALVDAQELYYAARKRSEDLGRLKQAINQKMSQPQRGNVDPRVFNNARSWMESKTWYDPTGQDEDSYLTTQIDNRLAAEGWDPRTPEYWTELDARLQKYLPHRFTTTSSVSYTENNQSARRSTPPTSGSGQDGRPGSSTQYRLSPERVRAMKEAGMWDDPDKRKKMIQRYMEQDKNSR